MAKPSLAKCHPERSGAKSKDCRRTSSAVFSVIPSSESLSRARVIRRRAIFDAARNQGRRVNNRWFTLNFLPRDAAPPGETGHVAFLTPKRLGSATVRNRLRRRMREIYRRQLQRPGETHCLIWIARPPALELDFEGLKKSMAELKRRLDANVFP